MAEPSEVTTLVLDLAVLLKAFRGVQQEAAQVGTQLAAQLQACRELDARAAQTVGQAVERAAQTLTQTVQQGTVALQDGQRQAVEQVGAAVQRQHATLLQEWQRVVAQATRARHWVPWQMGAVLLLVLLLVNGGWMIWWGRQQAAERPALQQAQRLAAGLDRYLVESLYPQLPKAQQREVDAVYQAAQVASPSTRRR